MTIGRAELQSHLHCPICKSDVPRWEPGGVPGRNKMFCPKCDSKPRHRMIWAYLLQHGLMPKPHHGRTLLHIAPEECMLKRLADRFGDGYVACDINADRPGVTHSFSVENIPFQDNHFDLIICNHVLEHVGNDRAAINEFARVLKRLTGIALITIPLNPAQAETFEDPSATSPEQRERLFGQFDHVRAYGADVVARFTGAGLLVAAVSGKQIAGANAKRYGIQPNETLFIGTRVS